jgi:hypothetical protein
MNLQRKLICSLAVFLSFGAFAAEEKGDLKWGVTLGVANLDYESDQPGTETSYFEDATYTPMVYGIDVGRGKHSVSYKVTSAGKESYNLERTPPYDYTSTERVDDRKRDHEETTITYQYQLSGGWGLGIQYNDVENNYSNDGKSSYTNYDWDFTTKTKAINDGWGFFGTYVKPITDTKWVFAAKLGVIELNYESEYSSSETIMTTTNVYDFITDLDGSTISGSSSSTGDATSAIIGLTMAYVASPKSVVYFNFDTRVDDFGELNTEFNPETYTGYFAGVYDDTYTPEDQSIAAGIEETNWKFSVEWRYALN